MAMSNPEEVSSEDSKNETSQINGDSKKSEALKAFEEFQFSENNLEQDLAALEQLILEVFPNRSKVRTDKVMQDQLIAKLPEIYVNRLLDEYERRHKIQIFKGTILEELIGDSLYSKLLEWHGEAKNEESNK